MKLKYSAWIFAAMMAPVWLAAADQAADSSTTTTNQPALVATNATSGTDAPAEPQVPGDTYTNSIGMVLLKMPGGYWAGKYEVTQKEYQDITKANPSAFVGNNFPVDSVSWNDALAFCDKLTEHELDTNAVPKGFYYTLPTEDEWQAMVADASLENAVTSQNGPRTGSSPVGSMPPNSLGLYDVRGNVMEFCLGDTSKPYRILRGGSWQDHIEQNLRTDFRYYCKPEDTGNTFGFRCVLKQK